jgi:hypothetical protein
VHGDPVNNIDPSGHAIAAPDAGTRSSSNTTAQRNNEINKAINNVLGSINKSMGTKLTNNPAPSSSLKSDLESRVYTSISIPSGGAGRVLNDALALARDASAKVQAGNIERIGVAGLSMATVLGDKLQITLKNALAVNRQFCSGNMQKVNSKGKTYTEMSLAEYNYKQNLKLEQPTSYIQGQNSVSEFKMGHTTSDRSGCGWVAIYNAFVAMGDYVKPADLIYYIEKNDGLRFKGHGGVKSSTLNAFLKEKGYASKVSTGLSTSLDDAIHECRVLILEYAWFRGTNMGMHYVAIKYNKLKNRFFIYNEYNNSTAPNDYLSIDEWFSSGAGKILISVIRIY